jgi:hypothetical protein
MHIKHIHDMIEKLSECAKMEFEKGIDNINAEEMGEVIDMIKDLAEAEYYSKISKAMDESEYGDDYDYKGAYDEQSRKGYRGQRRDSRGRYMKRMGYEEPMYYTMTPEMYREHEPEYYRDLDRNSMNRMYYSDGMSDSTMDGSKSSEKSSNMNHSAIGRDHREGKSGQMRRSYMESKEMGKDKGEKMKELENYMKELSSDVTEMISDASPEEKTMLRQKLQMLTQKI